MTRSSYQCLVSLDRCRRYSLVTKVGFETVTELPVLYFLFSVSDRSENFRGRNNA